MSGYKVEWDGLIITLPAAKPSPGPEHRQGFFQDLAAVVGLTTGGGESTRWGKPVGIHLIPRPDNDYNEWAVAISLPHSGSSSVQERHLGYLYDDYLAQLGEQVLHRLARYSDGEIRCTAFVSPHTGDLNALALPKPAVLRRAFEAFLSAPSTPPLSTRPMLRELIGFEYAGDALTRVAFDHLGTFSRPGSPIGHLVVSSVHNGRGRPRSLSLREEITGRHLGEVALGFLFLDDERDRPAVLERLADLGLPVAQPANLHPAATCSGARWPTHQVPNMWTYWFIEGLDFRPRDPEHPRSQESIAQYNPTTKLLYVEDDALVAPTCIYAARVGVEVSEIQVPGQRWHMEREFRYRERRDLDLRPENYREVDVKPELWKVLQSKLPVEVVGDDVSWKPGVPSHAEFPTSSDSAFAMHEASVQERSALFPRHKVTGRFVSCRLCGEPGTEFTTPGCSGPLAYCHLCLRYAHFGVFDSISQAAAALKFLTKKEYSNRAPLEQQLASLHLSASSPESPEGVDWLMVARYAIRRGKWPWTRLLARAGLLGEGLRMARGTVMEAADGHLCLSMQEKAVDDFFHQHGVRHDREPLYPYDAELNPLSRRRADWLLADGTLVEMWGMLGDPAYAAKMRDKERLAARCGINLVGLTLPDIPRLPDIFEGWMAGDTPANTGLPRRERRVAEEEGQG